MATADGVEGAAAGGGAGDGSIVPDKSFRSAATTEAVAMGLFPGLQRSCARCDTRDTHAALRCGRCKATWYCSAACQKQDWKIHCVECKKPTSPPLTTVRDLKEKPVVDDFAISATDIGAGNFSRVMRSVYRRTREILALKQIDKPKVARMAKRHKNIHNEILMEKEVLMRLDHPGIAKLYHTFQDQVALYFIFEFVPGGELWKQLVQEDGKMVACGETRARYYCYQLVEVLEYLHLNGIAHRDVKPENVMLSSTGAIKLVDFGTSKDLVDGRLNGGEWVGTPDYMPPELVNNSKGGRANDLWALGCILYQMLVGRTPFKAPSAYLTFQRVQAMDYTIPPFITGNARDLIENLLVEDPDKRLGSSIGGVPDFAPLKSHPFFENCGWPGRTPVRSLSELSMDAAAQAVVGHEDLGLDAEALHHSICVTMKEDLRERLKHAVALRKGLLRPTVYRLFFDHPADARFSRAGAGLGYGRGGRGFLGFEHEDEGQWKSPYLFVIVADVSVGSRGSKTATALEELVSRVNKMVPLPRHVTFLGRITEAAHSDGTGEHIAQLDVFKSIVAALDENVSLVFVPGDDFPATTDADGTAPCSAYPFGDLFFSFWCGGFRGLVLSGEVDSANCRLAKTQRSWLNREMPMSKFGAQHMCVFCAKPFVELDDMPSPGTELGPPPVARNPRASQLFKIRHNNVRAVFSVGNRNESFLLGKRSRHTWRKHFEVEPDDSTDEDSEADDAEDSEHEVTDGDRESKGAEAAAAPSAPDTFVASPGTAQAAGKKEKMVRYKRKGRTDDTEGNSTQVIYTMPFPASPGARVVKVFMNFMEHDWYSLDELPVEYDLSDEASEEASKEAAAREKAAEGAM